MSTKPPTAVAVLIYCVVTVVGYGAESTWPGLVPDVPSLDRDTILARRMPRREWFHRCRRRGRGGGM